MNSLTQLHYFFDGRRIYNSGTVSETTKAKEILQRVFRDKADEWFDESGSDAENKFKLLFVVTNKTKFLEEINNLSSAIYRFVKVK